MIPRETRYGGFKFQIDFGDGLTGGFSEVSGLEVDRSVAESRGSADTADLVRNVPGLHNTHDITLKRGLLDQEQLFNWVQQTRADRDGAKRTVSIRLFDEARSAVVASWKLTGVLTLKFTGPTLSGKGGGDVAIEELVLGCEGIEVEDCSVTPC